MTPPTGTPLVRARHFAATVSNASPPLDTVHFSLFHPAVRGTTDTETQTGVLPVDTTDAPWPLVIWLGGINVSPHSYRWLAMALAEHGIATITFSHVGQVSPESVGLSPGLDLSALEVGHVGSRPSATAIGPILDGVRSTVDTDLSDAVDLSRVFIGGHSAGGTVALLNGRPEWVDGLAGVISYGGHTRPAARLGHEPGTILPVAETVPALVMGGTEDGVIAASTSRYEVLGEEDPNPLRATFDRGVTAPGSVLAIISGGTHLSVCHPIDTTSARGFLEADDAHGNDHRQLIVALAVRFIHAVGSAESEPAEWADFAASRDLAEFRLL